jgi:hypothetical protein
MVMTLDDRVPTSIYLSKAVREELQRLGYNISEVVGGYLQILTQVNDPDIAKIRHMELMIADKRKELSVIDQQRSVEEQKLRDLIFGKDMLERDIAERRLDNARLDLFDNHIRPIIKQAKFVADTAWFELREQGIIKQLRTIHWEDWGDLAADSPTPQFKQFVEDYFTVHTLYEE